MGVPAFFRWLSEKYPKIISGVREEEPQEIDGEEIPIDISGPNPNGEEFDNLYLDMNGIVHPCSHPEDRPAPKNEEEMMLAIFEYTERVVNMVRPRKVLMMAVDGVAPRAKMNQQRSRRFRSALDAKKKEEQKAEFRREFLKKNGHTADEDESEEEHKVWDSNVITPGTPFMDTLALSLRYWTAYKLNTDSGWQKLKVIISDATVPGEGEHKIMEFIRSQRRSPEHDPNTRHVIYGLDADLIMLGLATHEPHFRVLREDVFFQSGKPRTCRMCGQEGHLAADCTGKVKPKAGDNDEKQVALKKPFIWLHVNVLREYLFHELSPLHPLPFKFDLERAIDDWVFLCFFVGNDFLPHFPSLEIKEEGIDILTAIWRDNLPHMGGYVTEDGDVNLSRAQFILDGLAKQEDAIFKRRKTIEDKREAGRKRRKMLDERNARQNSGQNSPTDQRRKSGGGKRVDRMAQLPANMPVFTPDQANSREVRNLTHEMFVNRTVLTDSNKSAAAMIKEQMRKLSESANTQDGSSAAGASQEAVAQTAPSALGKRKAELMEADEVSTPGRTTPNPVGTPATDPDGPPPDEVRLWEEGYADRYYERKFGVDPENIAFRHKVANDYVEGLCWVLKYYMQGCPSWTWYYPHHYAPFAADFSDIGKLDIKFDLGVPFRPFEQLMGVLPARSGHAIPEPFRELMTDENSEIKEFYPEDFVIDLNGKKFEWQGVALLPFIDEKKLLDAMAKKYPLLTKEDRARNEMGKDVLLFSTNHPLYEEVLTNFYTKKQGAPKYKLNQKRSEGLAGHVEKHEEFLPQTSLLWPLTTGNMPDLDEDNSMRVHYSMPHSIKSHKSMLLRGVEMPLVALDQDDINKTNARKRNSGRNYGGAPLREDGGYHNGRGRGGKINYANPVAQHLNPNFDPSFFNRAPPPPHMMDGPPPPPWANPSGGYQGGYNRGPPPPPPSMSVGVAYSQGSYGQGYQNGGGQGYGRGGSHGGQDDYYRPSRNGDRGAGYGGGYGGGYNGGYGRGGRDPRDSRGYGDRYDGRRY